MDLFQRTAALALAVTSVGGFFLLGAYVGASASSHAPHAPARAPSPSAERPWARGTAGTASARARWTRPKKPTLGLWTSSRTRAAATRPRPPRRTIAKRQHPRPRRQAPQPRPRPRSLSRPRWGKPRDHRRLQRSRRPSPRRCWPQPRCWWRRRRGPARPKPLCAPHQGSSQNADHADRVTPRAPAAQDRRRRIRPSVGRGLGCLSAVPPCFFFLTDYGSLYRHGYGTQRGRQNSSSEASPSGPAASVSLGVRSGRPRRR